MLAHRPSKATGGIAAYGGTSQPGNAEEKGDAAKVIIHIHYLAKKKKVAHSNISLDCL